MKKPKKLIEINYPGDKHIEEFERISNQDIGPDQQKKLLAILEAFAALPIVIPCTKSSIKQDHKQSPINVTTNINNANSQTQNQQQSFAAELFLEAIKDNLTGRQIKELKEVVTEADNDLEKARPGIIEKLKSFGTDVVSNIVANILTNTAI
ncbi:MAG: peptide chain release factor 1 [Paraprevotella sp.]|nr:peptide chain release factor 1 [Paraprevotella sp.]